MSAPEVVGRRYLWNSRKRSRRQHLEGLTGESLCLLEHGSGRVDTISNEPAPNRALCRICLSLHRSGKRDRAAGRSKDRKKAPAPGRPATRRRAQGQHYYQGPIGEQAWRQGPLGKRFAQLLRDTD